MEENKNKCRICGNRSERYRICDNCYIKWNEDRVICQICEQKKTSSKIGVCPTCKTPLVEALNFLKSKTDYWNLIKEKVKKSIILGEKEFRCLTENCKTKFLISDTNINKVIVCPVCRNRMH